MLKLSDLAQRPDLSLGPLLISPSLRRVVGPAGAANVEPLIMQALLLLFDARGNVVTRSELFDQLWGGVMVGDDSLNRAIAGVRRIAAETAPGLFEVETIPRTGYRLIGDLFEQPLAEQPVLARQFPRRAVIVGAFAVAGAGGLGLWSVRQSRADRQFNDLMDRGKQAIRYGDPSTNGVEYFRQAVALQSDDPKSLGLLAYARSMDAEVANQNGAGTAAQSAESAARAALRLDPNEPNARLALTVLQRSTLDLAATEDRVRAIIATDPTNIFAMRQLWSLLQSAGRSRDALALVERAIAIEPLAAANNYPRAQLLWILGRTAEADRVIDRAMHYWPSHRFVRFARFTIFAFTDRPRAALAMLDKRETTPQGFTPEAVALWRVSLAALDQRTPASIAAARRANLEATHESFALTNQAVLALSALGEIDAAFEIANELLLFHGSGARRPQAAAKAPPAKSTAWRFTPWLFTPPVAALRADPRFNTLCDGIGLTEYWAKRRIKPDYQLGLT